MATEMQLEVILIGEVDWRKSIKLTGQNRKNWGRNGAQGSLHWWRRVDKITLRKEKLGSRPAKLNEKKGERDLERETKTQRRYFFVGRTT